MAPFSKTSSSRRRSHDLAWLITAPLALVALIITFVLISNPRTVGEWPLGALFLGLFVAANATVLIFEMRRGETIVSNVVDIPFVLALFYLPPVTLIIVRILTAVIMQVRRKSTPVKFAFNVANLSAATSVAAAVVYAQGKPDPYTPEGWVVLAAGVFIASAVSLLAVVAVITVTQGGISRAGAARTALPALAVSLVNVPIGLVVLMVLQVTLWSILLIVALAGFFALAYRSYASSVRQHRTLTEIYDLTRSIAETPHDGTLSDVLLSRVRSLFQAEHASLWLPAQGRFPEVFLAARYDNHGLLDVAPTPESLRRRVFEEGKTYAIGPGESDEALKAEIRKAGVKDAIAVPLRAGSAVIGTLEVAGRLGDYNHFTVSDVQLLETVAAHAAVAVENSRLVDRLRYDAAHDGLTGLANRRRVTAALEESVSVRAPGEMVAVLLFDVDGLRQVNESLGHAAGDKVLAEVARRLRASAPSSALVGRLGGDEFAVTLRVDHAEAALALAGEMRQQIRDQMVFGTLTLDVETAVGVVVHPDHGSDAATLLQRADLATTAAKTVTGSVQLFNPGLESRSVRRLSLAGDLRRAIDNDDLEIYFQPKVTLADRRLIGVECLARWEHPAHGAVSPEDFVAVAEHTGQLGRLTEAVLKEGLRRCRDWEAADHPLSIAVNLSARTLIDPDFPTRVQELLQEYGVAPHRLTFEIKEQGVLDGTDRPMPTLRRLRDIGVRLSVDDFGTGYSSLSYLRRLPVNEIKVDRSFVQGMATDPGDLAIVNAVVTLSQQFGLTVVAEGVESELTLELLQDIGCEVGQGFLFSRPLPYERLEAWFSAQTETEPTPTGEVRRLRAVT